MASGTDRAGAKEDTLTTDGSLSAKNKDHLAAGLWAVYTINPNAWSGVRKYFDKTVAEVVIAQEANVREEAIGQAEQSAKLVNWSCSLKECHAIEKEGGSASVAFVAERTRA